MNPADFTPTEAALHAELLAGRAVVVNMRRNAHARLWEWALEAGLAVRVDRKSPLGNPFLLEDDGTRAEVCDFYELWYWPHKTSLHHLPATLRGKALGCWCAPERCHADFLAELANSEEVAA
jgi:hypothetical protein